jgi:hypothetical protein
MVTTLLLDAFHLPLSKRPMLLRLLPHTTHNLKRTLGFSVNLL